MTYQHLVKPTSVTRPIIVGISGASGSILARATVDALLDREIPTIVVCTNGARLVWQEEMDEPFSQVLAGWMERPNFTHYALGDLRASIASGTFATGGMAIVPCSMNTVASVAHGLANNLLLRAADVCLKERRKLVLVPRETPLHSTHLENMLALSRNGATILPPEPAFYLKPKSMDDVARFVAQRVLVSLDVMPELSDEYQYREAASPED